MEINETGLTFDMIGNMSEEEIQDLESQETNVTEDDDTLFGAEDATEEKDLPEGVGEESQEEESITEEGGASPNFYASIATSLKKDGILNLLDETDFESVNDASDLASLFQKQIDNLLNDSQRRINEALQNDVPIDQVKQYENIISYLGRISESDLKEETSEMETLRGNIIVQDYINKGFSPERANKEAKKSFDAGTDVEDALDALADVKEYYSNSYNTLLSEAKANKEKNLKIEKEETAALEKRFLDTEEPITGIKLTQNERKKLKNQFSNFIDKDEQGAPLNAIQKYAKDNPEDYQYIINTLFYLTDGFKNVGKVVSKEVKKQTKSALTDLERKLRNPSNMIGSGNLDFGNDRSPESFQGFSVALD